MTEEHRCDKCGEVFDSERGLADDLGVFIAPSLIIDDDVEKSYWSLHGLETEQRYESVIESAISSSKQRS